MKKLITLLLLLAALPTMAQKATEYQLKLKNKMQMSITVCTDGIFRVRLSPRQEFAENLMIRYGVQKNDWKPVSCSTQEKGGVFTITTAK